MKPVIDPRRGDVEDDASSSKRRSLLSLAGSLLAEISLPKLAVAWFLLIVGPGLVLGVAPVVAAIWVSKLSTRLEYPIAGIWPLVILAVLVGVGWFGGRTLFRLAENSFWSLNSLAVQPAYTMCREAVRQLAEDRLPARATKAQRSRLRRIAAIVSGAVICAVALAVVAAVLPSADLLRGASGVGTAGHLAVVALANTVVLVAAYLAVAALVWAIADATMAQPQDLDEFAPRPSTGRTWRIAHLSDVHTVGEFYGRRIESGRSGASGNERLHRSLAQLDRIHAEEPLDVVLVSGDMTDAGRSSEWAEFLDAVSRYPDLAARTLMIPGNHDLNIVDRANPARLDLPTSPNKRLRKLRVLSAMGMVQGERVHVVDRTRGRLGGTLAQALTPHLGAMARFADTGKPIWSKELTDLWPNVFPMVLAPERDDGLGIILLELERRHPFFLHQRAGIDHHRSGPRPGERLRAIPAGVLGRRAASPRGGVSASGEAAVDPDRHGAGQRQLVRAAAQAARPPHRADARPPPHRLDRRMRRHADHLGAVAGHGGDRRDANVFLHSQLRGGGGRASQAAAPAADQRGGRAGPRGLEPAGSIRRKTVAGALGVFPSLCTRGDPTEFAVHCTYAGVRLTPGEASYIAAGRMRRVAMRPQSIQIGS